MAQPIEVVATEGQPGVVGVTVDPSAFELVPGAIAVVDPRSGVVLSANLALSGLLGLDRSEIVGRHWPEPLGGGVDDLVSLVERSAVATAQIDLRTGTGTGSRWWRQSVSGVDDRARGRLLIIEVDDRTDHHRRTLELERLAERDELTGVWNRRRFGRELRRGLDVANTYGIGVVLFDVDGFKSVNDVHGHAAGDAALVAVGASLERAAPEGSLVARLAGDEFAVLVVGASDEETKELCLALTQQARSVDVSGSALAVTLSAGWTVAQPGLDAEQRARDALIEADVSMYAAKARARSGNRRVLPSEARPLPTAWLDEQASPPTVTLNLWSQPVIAADGRRAVMHDVVLEPADVDQQSGTILLTLPSMVGLLHHIRRDYGRQLAVPDRYLVHLPGIPLGVGSAVAWIRRAADEVGLDPGSVVFALPEATIGAGGSPVLQVLAGLRHHGFGVAVSDFGAEMGSLGLLTKLRPDQIWLAPSLLADGVDGPVEASSSRVLVEAAVLAARRLGAQVGSAAGESMLNALIALGIDLALVPDDTGLRPLGGIEGEAS